MPIGSPSISDVKNLDVRSIAQAVSNIRQRIEQLERLSGQLPAAASTASVSLGNILSQLAALTIIVNNLGNLLTMIEALPFSSGVDANAEVPVVMGGVAFRVTAGDIARLASGLVDLGLLISALPFSSAVDPGWFVPVEIGGIAMRVTAGDIARLASSVANLGTLIAAAPFSSGVDPHWQVPVETGGVAFRVDARDIAALVSQDLEALIQGLPVQSGADSAGFVPVSLHGVGVQMQLADILALVPASSARYARGATWANGGIALTTPANDVAITCQATGIIQSVILIGIGGTGSAVVDIWKAPFSGTLPVVGNSITAAAKPTLSSGVEYQDTTLTGWTKAVTKGDVLLFHLDSVSIFTGLTVLLEIA